MAISFTNIPSGIRVPLFLPKVNNCRGIPARNNLAPLLIGQLCSAGKPEAENCPLYTSNAAAEKKGVNLGGARIIKKKKLREK